MSVANSIFRIIITNALSIIVMQLSISFATGQEDVDLFWRNGVLFSLSSDGAQTTVVGSVTGYIEREGAEGQMEIIKTTVIPENLTSSFQNGEPPEITRLRQILKLSSRMTPRSRGLRAHQPNQKISQYGFVFVFQGFELAKSVLDLSLRQEEEISKLIERYRDDVKQLNEQVQEQSEIESRDSMISMLLKLRLKYSALLEGILLPHQIKTANANDASSLSVFEILSSTHIGKMIELQDLHKKRLLKRTSELAERINEELRKARIEASKIIEEELSEEQREKLNDLLPGIVDRQIKNSNIVDFLLAINIRHSQDEEN